MRPSRGASSTLSDNLLGGIDRGTMPTVTLVQIQADVGSVFGEAGCPLCPWHATVVEELVQMAVGAMEERIGVMEERVALMRERVALFEER